MVTIDPRALRAAFGSFLTGVTVVTTRDADGILYGFTANSFSSVSLDPPLLLVCPGRFLSSFSKFESCENFAVSVLAEGQEGVSNIFASSKGDRFAQAAWTPDAQNIPVIAGASATFSCRTEQVISAGDHIILLGEVTEFQATEQRGLGYAAGQYFSLGLEREAMSAPKPGYAVIAGAIIEHEGKMLLSETKDGWSPPQLKLDGRMQVRRTLEEYLSGIGSDARLGKAFSIFDDRQQDTHYTYFHARSESDAIGSLGTFIPIARLADLTFASDAHAAMMRRYALEYETKSFGLYIGDERDGDIHDLEYGS